MDLEALFQQGVLNRIDRSFAAMIQRISGEPDPLVVLAAGLLSRAAAEGDVCLDLAALVNDGIRTDDPDRRVMLKVPLDKWRQLLADAPVVGGENEKNPIILVGNLLYLQRYWNYENIVSQEIIERCRLNGATEGSPGIELFNPGHIHETQRDPYQDMAVRVALQKRFTVISGGPGTGKTTTIARIIMNLHRSAKGKPPRIMLAAPTGKAAARMQEALDRGMARLSENDNAGKFNGPIEAKTLHRMLEIVPGRNKDRFTQQNPLPADMVIIDEASMVDLALMAKLVQAVSRNTRLILVGDKDQLASVEAGAVMGDICAGAAGKMNDSGTKADPVHKEVLSDHIVVLQNSYRFGADSGIDELGSAINSGNSGLAMKVLDDPGKIHVVFKSFSGLQDIEREMPGMVMEAIAPVFDIEEPLEALRALEKIKILTPIRKGPFGVSGINQLVERILRRNEILPSVTGWGDQWYSGRPVMINRNDYHHNLFNGDVGITMVDDSRGEPRIRVVFPDSDGQARYLVPEQLPDHQTVYAMTVHKCQGTEFDKVLLILPDRDAPLLTRELIYTAVTRARQTVEVWGRRDIFAAAIKRCIHRASGLRNKLWQLP